MEHIAVIDLGSNSIRFVIMEINNSGAYWLIYQEKKSIRLAKGMNSAGGRLTEDAQKRAIHCMKIYAHIASIQKVTNIFAVATAAVRNAVNGSSFLKRVRAETGIPMTIISGRAEAALGFSGVIHTIDCNDFLLFDLGGASIEISLVRNKKRIHSVSLPIGAVNITEKFNAVDNVTNAQLTTIRTFIQKKLKSIPWFPKKKISVIGVGGTARNLAKVHQRAKNYPISKLHNYQIDTKELLTLIENICHKTLGERQKISGLSYERADIIIAGSLVISEIIKACHANLLTISGCGLREGLFFHYYDQKYKHVYAEKDILFPSIKNYTTILAPESMAHSRYVTTMALSLFDQCQTVHGLDKNMRKLLKAAGLLHDIGTVINYYGHSRHSAYISANAPIFGWTQKEQIMCSLIIAFHHGYSGKIRRHSGYIHLFTQEEWHAIKIAALFLAIAEALDESYEQIIGRLVLHATDTAFDMRIYIKGEDYDVPAHAILPYYDAIEKLFMRPLHVEWFPNSRTAEVEKEAQNIL